MPLIEHTYRSAQTSRLAEQVIVATDHERVVRCVEGFGGHVLLTSTACRSGTDRVAEVAQRLPERTVLVNVQGDEPEISGAAIDLAIQLLEQPDVDVATLATPIRDRTLLDDPACVKVVFDQRGRALYFSRSPIPCARDWDDQLLQAEPANFWQHVGLYAYRRDYLLQLARQPQSPLERLESLEQLRVLSTGGKIAVGQIHESAVGIDTPADYRAFVSRYRARTMTGKVA